MSDLYVTNAIIAAKTAKSRLANSLSKYDEFYFDIRETAVEDVFNLIEYLKLYAVEDDGPIAMIDVENNKPQGLTIFIHQKVLGTANHVLIKHRIAEFMIASNAVFKTAQKAKICCNCKYGHEEPICPYAGEVSVYYTCKNWKLWKA